MRMLNFLRLFSLVFEQWGEGKIAKQLFFCIWGGGCLTELQPVFPVLQSKVQKPSLTNSSPDSEAEHSSRILTSVA